MTPSQLIAFLNAVTCGDLDAIAAKLDEGIGACVDLGEDELGGMLREARDALLSGELKTYRKRVETVVARLGHVRAKQGKLSRPAVGSA
jgi:hypothetical protein